MAPHSHHIGGTIKQVMVEGAGHLIDSSLICVCVYVLVYDGQRCAPMDQLKSIAELVGNGKCVCV